MIVRLLSGENDIPQPIGFLANIFIFTSVNPDSHDKDVISMSCSKQKPFDIISATYQKG